MLGTKTIYILLSATLALLPALFWGYIFYKKQPENKIISLKVFIAGALSVAPLLLYKYLWQYFPWINAFTYANTFKEDLVGFSNFAVIPVDIIITFMIVGVIEELAKFSAVKMMIPRKLCSITDYIEFFIIAALGFSFAENIIYFYNIMSVRGTENILLPFIFRSLFSTFAHVLFSGMCGYYVGLAHFAEPLLEEKYNQKKWGIIKKISKLIGYKKELLFHEEKIIQGVVTAVILHALFNIFLEMNWTFLLIPFLTIGFIFLSYLFDNNKVDKNYCYIK